MSICALSNCGAIYELLVKLKNTFAEENRHICTHRHLLEIFNIITTVTQFLNNYNNKIANVN